MNALDIKDRVMGRVSRLSRRLKEMAVRWHGPRVIRGKYGLRYLFLPGSALDRHLLLHGILPDWIALHVGEIVPPDGIVFDVGANVGLLTAPFAKQLPRGQVYAFEPDFENTCQLYVNVRLNDLDNVVIESLALQDNARVREIALHIRRAVDGDGLVNQGLSTLKQMPVHTIAVRDVPASTIDVYVHEKSITRIDLIKVDVEGAEQMVLKGAECTLSRMHPIVLYEFSTEIDRLTQTENSTACFRLMENLGYRQYEIVREQVLVELLEVPVDRHGCNVLCWPPSRDTAVLSSFVRPAR